MALSRDEIKQNYPLPSYNYVVEFGSVPIGFSEVSGLSITRETVTYKESSVTGLSPVVMNMPAQRAQPTVSLKKGVVRTVSKAQLYDWINSIYLNQVDKQDIFIRLTDESGKAVISWKLVNAFPKSLAAPSFSASSNDAAIESMELMGDSIEVTET